MGEMCYAVKCFNNHPRYTYSEILADIWAKKYGSEIYLAFDVPKYLIEWRINEKNSYQNLDEINQD